MIRPPSVILYDSTGTAMAVQNGVALPAGTRALVVAGVDNAGNARFLDQDSISGGLVTIDVAHHKIHSGSGFFCSSTGPTSGAGGIFDILLRTDGIYPHMMASFDTDDAHTWSWYENTVVSANGVALPAFNSNRNNVSVPGLTLYSGPTVTGVGTLLANGLLSTTSKVGGSEDWSRERILKTGTNYLFRFTKVAAGTATVDFRFVWYE